MDTKPIHSIVLDAGPIIKNEPPVSTLVAQSEVLYTIPSVVEEIRDPITRARMETTLLPFVKVRAPQASSIKTMTEFARRTGDLEVLSTPDVHLLALTYELECERNHGDWRLRSVPGQKRLNGSPPEILRDRKISKRDTGEPGEPGETGETGQTGEIGTDTSPTKTQSLPKAPQELRGAWGSVAPRIQPHHALKRDDERELQNKLEGTHLDSPDDDQHQIPNQVDTRDNESPLPQAAGYADDSFAVQPAATDAKTSEADDLDEDGWITPSNLKKHQQKDTKTMSQLQDQPGTIQVALITSDFAMQNVLLRMNLNLLSTSLQRIRQVKTWMLRCHGCFYITKDMTKQFCSRCGKPTLLRTSCSTDAQGNFKTHLKKNMQWNTRGNVYSIPKPVSGTSNGKTASGGGKGGWGQELILAEDQKEYVRAVLRENKRKEKDLMDEDYLPSILSGDRGKAGGRPKIGAGKGVNSRKRR